ncbi:MAG: potassium:proton antiporter [Brevundimonas sp.]|uniref:monovalent cation/H(+) antiporter subunit G n=1 Tax=Brevundimonas sp. TaxID=1871086 RepID=UPI001203EAAF|nr:monovalent cation/H(+) antiporter subunit G [Brevundimonas sp.]RZJ18098.1 MAG: potassium:proton antiporter [Brevundimonas sp.]
MSVASMPEWAATVIAVLAVGGAGLSLLGAVGLVRLSSFYDRVHAPTLGATLGMALILVASWLYFGTAHGRWLPRELLIAVFLTVTTPVTLILLARAALFRDRTEQSEPQEKPVPMGGDQPGG